MQKKHLASAIMAGMFLFNNFCFASFGMTDENAEEWKMQAPATTTSKLPEAKEVPNSSLRRTNDGTPIYDFSSGKTKIKWKDEFISQYQVDEDKVRLFMKQYPDIKEEDIDRMILHGLSGDFLELKKFTVGDIDTALGSYELIWIATPGSDKPYAAICNESLCSQNIYIKAIEQDTGLLYGNFKRLLPNPPEGIEDSDFIGLAHIGIKDFFNKQPSLNIRKAEAPAPMHKLKFSEKNKIVAQFENAKVDIGHLDDPNNTIIYLVKNNNTSEIALALESGVRVYTRNTDDADVFEIFYIDFNNDKDTSNAKVVSVARVKKSDILGELEE